MPAKKTREAKELAGTLQPCREPQSPVQAQYGLPAAPSGLTSEQQRVFLETCAVLHQMRVLALSDRNLIERYAVAIVEEREMRADVAKNGLYYTVTHRDGTTLEKPRQVADLRLRRESILLNYESKLGLTPVDRGRIEAKLDDGEAPDSWSFLEQDRDG